MDQQAALRWVQANVAGFGGDRHAVTIAGESAGGLSALAQVASPGANGLFARAISESGTYQLDQATLAQAETAGATFATKTGCTDNSSACLRALPVSTILADQNQAGYRPNIDVAVLPRTIGQAFAANEFTHVPVLLGNNENEYSLFVAQAQLLQHFPPVTAGNYVSYIQGSLGVSNQAASAIAAQYPVSAYASPQLALTAVGTDGSFACNAETAEDALSHDTAVYAYEFRDQNAPQRYLPSDGFPYGASHTSELSYLFDLSAPIPAQFTTTQQTLASQMQQYWTSFVKDGRPWAPDAPRWPTYHASTQRLLALDTPAPTIETDFGAQHQCAFWNAAN
jgi:para-nitrobenzyl esterase